MASRLTSAIETIHVDGKGATVSRQVIERQTADFDTFEDVVSSHRARARKLPGYVSNSLHAYKVDNGATLVQAVKISITQEEFDAAVNKMKAATNPTVVK